MRLGEINPNITPSKPKLYLCKPNKTVIRPLNDIDNLNSSARFASVSELTFEIPTMIERDHELVENPLLDEIKHRFYFKLVQDDITEYFIHYEQNKKMSENEESVLYKAFGSSYELADKQIRDYEAVSQSLSQMAGDILQESTWKVNYVDADFDTKLRSHEIASMTILQAILELAEKFNAIIVWDTRNEYINFYKPNNVGLNKGLRLKEDKYLESFEYSSNAEEVVTRLKVYGKEGLTFRSLTPTGSNYLEDFSYFKYPFERDSSGNVVKHSTYMSDELCIALEEYEKVLVNKQGQFEVLTKQLTDKQNEIQQVEQQIVVLENDLTQILDELDVLNSNGDDGTPQHSSAIARRDTKSNDIRIKASQKTELENQKKGIESQINTLRSTILIDKNLNAQQLRELNKFTITKDHINETIVDEKDLLQEGIEVFESFREPKISLNVSIVNFLSSIESQNDWGKLALGDTVRIESKRLKMTITAKIIEINRDYENDSINLVIANEKEIKDKYSKTLASLYNANKTSTIVNMDKWKWDMIDDVNGVVNRMLIQAWDATKNAVVGGYKQDIQLTERGLIAKSPEDPMSWLILQHGMLAITNDGGNTWKHAIRSDGIVGERIIGKLILGTQLMAEDENGIIRIRGSLQEVFNKQGAVQVALGEFSQGKYGLRVNQGAIEIIGGLTRSNLSQDVRDTLIGADGIRGDLRMTAPLPTNLTLNGLGITATATGDPNRFARLDYRGLYAQNGAIDIRTGTSLNRGVLIDGNGIRAYDNSGTKKFDIDSSGNAMFAGALSAATGTFSGNLSAAGGTFSGRLSAASGSFSGDITGSNGTFYGALSSGSITSSTISGGTISGTTITGNTISGGTISGTTISGTTVSGGTVSGSTISGGTISGTKVTSATIDIYESASIGAGLYLRGSGNYTGIYFGSSQIMQDASGYLNLSNRISIGSFTEFHGSVDFSRANVTGLGASGGTTVRYSATSNRLYVDLNGVQQGYVNVI